MITECESVIFCIHQSHSNINCNVFTKNIARYLVIVRCVMHRSFRMRGMSSVVPLYQDHSSTSPFCVSVTKLYTNIYFNSCQARWIHPFLVALGPPTLAWPGLVPWVYISRLGHVLSPWLDWFRPQLYPEHCPSPASTLHREL